MYFSVSTEQEQDHWELVGTNSFFLRSPFTNWIYQRRKSVFQGMNQIPINVLVCGFTVKLATLTPLKCWEIFQERPSLVSRDCSENQFSWLTIID